MYLDPGILGLFFWPTFLVYNFKKLLELSFIIVIKVNKYLKYSRSHVCMFLQLISGYVMMLTLNSNRDFWSTRLEEGQCTIITVNGK